MAQQHHLMVINSTMTSDQHSLDLLNPVIKDDSMAENNQINNQFLSQSPTEGNYTAPPSRPKQRHIYESPEAKARRLGRFQFDFFYHRLITNYFCDFSSKC